MEAEMTRSAFGLIISLALAAPAATPLAQQPGAVGAASDPWTREELENLLAPIALYPDPILAQVLIAATYPDQVLAAHAHVRAFGSTGIDEMPWEISVKSVARYAPVLNLMAEGEDWTIAVGQAYASQPVDVMNSVQSLRRMANAQGNLMSTEQQQVVVEREVIRIVPAQPQIIYVPAYDPAVVYFRPVYVARAHPAYWSWGVGYPIGAWLAYDLDWWGHRVYYHGWHAGPRWVVVSRPFVVISPWYVGPRHTTVVINRTIIHRGFDHRPLRRHTVVHRNVTFDRRGSFPGRQDVVTSGWRDDRGGRVGPPATNPGRHVGPGDSDRGRRVGPPDSDRGRRTGPDVANRGRPGGPSAGMDGRRPIPVQSAGTTSSRRVTPIAGAPSATPRPSETRVAANRVSNAAPTAARTPSPMRETVRETVRSSNGTWNPRPPTTSTARPGSSARVPTSLPAQPTRTESTRPTAPRAQPAHGSSPRPATARRPGAPRESSPAATPRSGGSSTSAAAPARSGGGSRSAATARSAGRTTSAAAPARSGGGSRSAAPARSGGNGGSARSSGRGNGRNE